MKPKNWTGFLVLLAAAVQTAAAQEQPDRSPPGPPGRYQLIGVGEEWVFMLDTASGQTWKRSVHGQWQDAGNPARHQAPEDTARPAERPLLDLSEGPVDLSISQRGEGAVPGSEGTVLVRISDITAEQTVVRVVTNGGESLLPPRSMTVGNAATFHVAGRQYQLVVDELRNFLIGDDVAVITVRQLGDADERDEDVRQAAASGEREEDEPPAARTRERDDDEDGDDEDEDDDEDGDEDDDDEDDKEGDDEEVSDEG